ncbi:MAG: hemin ABC transporter ATP-binding protein [Solibacterales bacterium]|nr:hemin ABC transporter ATP-binding protein [Bryobacterales bacterium]
MNLFTLSDLRFRFDSVEVLRGFDLQLQAGEMTAIIGPNGAGKSTLMSILSGYLEGYEGGCSFLNVELREWKKQSLGQHIAFIPQLVRLEFPFTAEQVVLMGRTPHCRGLFESPEDLKAIRCAMEISNTVEFAHREFSSLSGGERQRVVLASALAQEAQVLLLDEPTTFLDLKNQLYTYSLLRNLAHSGMSVIAVTHDLNLAAQHADRLIVLAEGVIAADGHPNDVLKTDILADIFQINAKICKGPAERSWVFYEPAKPHQLDNYLLDKIKPQ